MQKTGRIEINLNCKIIAAIMIMGEGQGKHIHTRATGAGALVARLDAGHYWSLLDRFFTRQLPRLNSRIFSTTQRPDICTQCLRYAQTVGEREKGNGRRFKTML